jgi:hypothetical protein
MLIRVCAQTETHRGVHELLGPINQDIVRQACEALKTGDAPRLGAIMNHAQVCLLFVWGFFKYKKRPLKTWAGRKCLTSMPSQPVHRN